MNNKKLKRLAKELLSKLQEKIVPSGRPGPLIHSPTHLTKKDYRNAGRKQSSFVHGEGDIKEAIQDGLDPEVYWEEWEFIRDSFGELLNNKYRKYEWRNSDKVKKSILLRKARLEAERWKKR